MPPLASATTGHCYYRRRQLQPLSTAAAAVGRNLRRCRPLLPLPDMIDLGTLLPPRLVKEDLGTGAIPEELAAILAAHSQTVREDRMARTP